MDLLAPGGRSPRGLRFSLFGIPVTVSVSVVVLLAFLGIQLGDPLRISLWVAIGLLSILLHELGHALVARAAGARPRIQLAGLGGATTYLASPRTTSRGWSLAIGLAGPAVGILLGLAAVGLGAPCCGVAARAPLADYAWSVFVFVSLVWSVLNLLPVLPLDGGQALAAVLPGDEHDRQRRAAAAGAVIGGAATAAALLYGLPFAGVILGLLTWQNVSLWRAPDDRGDGAGDAAGAEERRAQLRSARDRLAEGAGDHQDAQRVQHVALAVGEHQLAAEVGEIALARGFTDPGFAYDAARAWAQLGALDRAAAQLERAIELGFDDGERLRDDPDLAPLRSRPDWTRLTGG